VKLNTYTWTTGLRHQSVVDWSDPASEARPVLGSPRRRESCRCRTASPWSPRGVPTDSDPRPDSVTRLSLARHREQTGARQVDAPVLSDPREGTPRRYLPSPAVSTMKCTPSTCNDQQTIFQCVEKRLSISPHSTMCVCVCVCSYIKNSHRDITKCALQVLGVGDLSVCVCV